MTGDQSRLLKVGDRVCWEATITDLGTVVGTAWSGVTIAWDDGNTTSVRHNDMAKVEYCADQALKKLASSSYFSLPTNVSSF
jgi:hypothetical protein